MQPGLMPQGQHGAAMLCRQAPLTCPKLAFSLAQMMSHIIASSHPPPRAKPFTAATMGILTCREQPAAGSTMAVSQSCQVQQMLHTSPTCCRARQPSSTLSLKACTDHMSVSKMPANRHLCPAQHAEHGGLTLL